MATEFQTGLDRCLADPPPSLRSARFGLLMNQASVDSSFRYACDLLAEKLPNQLAAIFTPQHGLWCEEQANMIESGHSRYEPLNLPIYSLYSETRQPTPEMLRGLNCFVIDLQDVGTRVYTLAWTIQNCLKACTAAKIPVIILDRPNPIGGNVAEGPQLEPGFESFVGGATIPLRHGLTLGELARLMNAEQKIGANLEVIPMTGWSRGIHFDETGRTWVSPSPNMQRTTTATLYPGQVLLEGTNLSEGRGTTTPFEVIGAPFINPHDLASSLDAADLPDLAIRPHRFVPTFDKFQGQRCGGIALHITDPHLVRSVSATVQILAAIHRLYPDQFAWLPPPYEYEREKMPIDILFGSSRLRQTFASDSAPSAATIKELVNFDEAAWWQRVSPYRLY